MSYLASTPRCDGAVKPPAATAAPLRAICFVCRPKRASGSRPVFDVAR